jgi:hypothetical protein
MKYDYEEVRALLLTFVHTDPVALDRLARIISECCGKTSETAKTPAISHLSPGGGSEEGPAPISAEAMIEGAVAKIAELESEARILTELNESLEGDVARLEGALKDTIGDAETGTTMRKYVIEQLEEYERLMAACREILAAARHKPDGLSSLWVQRWLRSFDLKGDPPP